jgi:hypothetical protein
VQALQGVTDSWRGDASGEHTRPCVWCSAPRRTVSRRDAGKLHAGTRALTRTYAVASQFVFGIGFQGALDAFPDAPATTATWLPALDLSFGHLN